MSNNARDLFTQGVLPQFEQNNPDWLTQARHIARQIAQRNGIVTIDDVRKECPPPPGKDPRVMGAVFAGKDWVRVGYKQSDRRECHGRPVSVFSLLEDLRND
jgi:hypothetical protein